MADLLPCAHRSRAGGDLTFAATTLESPQGLISVSWQVGSRDLALQVELPVDVLTPSAVAAWRG
jgi:hypothetical protein